MIPVKTRRRLPHAVAGALSLALLGVPIARPLLDAREASAATSIEVAHDPGRCSIGHDHLACSQLARSHSVPAGPLLPWYGIVEAGHPCPLRAVSPRAIDRHHTPLPRAPPAA